MTKRVVMGRQSDGTYGIRCSPPGYNAAANPVDESSLSFSSDWSSSLPAFLSGSVLNVSQGSTQTVSFTSPGYIPLGFFLMRSAGSGAWSFMPSPYNNGTVIVLAAVYDDHIKIVNNVGYAIDVGYALFQSLAQS